MSAMSVEAAPISDSGSGSAAALPADKDGDYYQVSIGGSWSGRLPCAAAFSALVWFSGRRPLFGQQRDREVEGALGRMGQKAQSQGRAGRMGRTAINI